MLDDAREETVSQTGDGEPDTEEAEALAAALNHSAERVQTLWFSFLTFMLYLAVATGTTTHRMLFLEEPLNLPVLNIKLPLLGFYVLTPLIFVVFHIYMLLNLVLLARTAKAFEDALGRAFREDGEARENFRMRIENTLFVQLLVGGWLEREGLNAKFLEVMAFITLALGPAVLLLMFEIMFLPYHSEWRTWLHRGLLALDLALVWTLWRAYRSGWGVLSWPKTSWRLVVPGVLSAVAVAYAVMVATFPDERMYAATYWLHGSATTHYWLHGPATTEVSSPHRPNWYAWIVWPNTLALRGEDLIDDAKLAHIIETNETSTGAERWVATLSLAKRDLTGADLSEADVRRVDFSGAILIRANLTFAWANEAHFNQAQLKGASLDGGQLQDASLVSAQLQGATLVTARLQGASLAAAQLLGALLGHSQLQGAALLFAQLLGAWLEGARLQGAWLEGARLQGASLDGARLQGASLDHAQLQGALLGNAQLQGASFVDVCAWRADSRQALWRDTWVERPKADEIHECDWTAASFAGLKQLIAKEVPEGDTRRVAMERIEQRLDPTKALEGEDEMAKIWAAGEGKSPTPEAYAKTLAGQWRELGCADEGAPYVLHALIVRLSIPAISPFRDQSDEPKSLAAAFLDEAHCAGAHGLSEADKAKLKWLAAPAAPQAPKP